MSRVVVLAMGSLGDVRPHLALARRLLDDGQDVLVMAMELYGPLVRAAGVPFAAIGASYLDAPFLQNRHVLKAMATSNLGSLVGVMAWSRTYADRMAEAVDRAVRPGDVLLSGVMAVDLATALVRDRGCRAVNVSFAATSPTADGRSTAVAPHPDRVSRLNALVTPQVYAAGVAMSLAAGNALRRRLGLPRHSRAAAARDALALPTLLATTPLLAPPVRDWPAHTYVTGPWIAAEDPSWQLDEGLTQFLASADRDGCPTAYVGFGSAATDDPVSDIELVADAGRRAGVRVVMRGAPLLSVVASYHGRGQDVGADGLHLVRDVPHEWLFPQLNAVVHHGGAGTTVAGLRSGVPSAIISHGLDQPYHLRRLRELGVGPGGFARRHLTADRLADLLRELTTGSAARRYALRAADVRSHVRAEDGVACAVDVLDRLGLLG